MIHHLIQLKLVYLYYFISVSHEWIDHGVTFNQNSSARNWQNYLFPKGFVRNDTVIVMILNFLLKVKWSWGKHRYLQKITRLKTLLWTLTVTVTLFLSANCVYLPQNFVECSRGTRPLYLSCTIIQTAIPIVISFILLKSRYKQ